MNNKKTEITNKIKSCKALRGKTIADIIVMPEFSENLGAYWTAQKQDRAAIRKSYDAMHKMGGAKGFKIPAHVIDDLLDLSVDDLALEFAKVIKGVCARPVAERNYIKQIGQQAYNLTIAKIVIKEFPELESELIPKTKSN